MRKNLVTIAVTTGTALAVAGALVTAPAADAAAHRGTTKIHASKKHTVSVAKTLRPGVVHFANTGSAPIVVIRQKKKKDGVAELVKLSNKSSAKSDRDLYKKYDVVEIALGKSDSWVKLKKGTYFVFDATIKKFKAKNLRTVTVRGKTSNAKAPKAKLIKFSSKGHIPGSTTIAHKSPIRVANHSKRLSFGLLLKVDAKASYTQIKQVVAHPTDAGIDSVAADDFFFDFLPAVVGPKHTVTATTKLGAGRYLILGGDLDKLSHGSVGLLTVK